MNISGIGSTQSDAASATKSRSEETVRQLADQGDPTAIAELKQQEQQQNPKTGATEPGKGEQIDEYA
jgi:hypothetical protein